MGTFFLRKILFFSGALGLGLEPALSVWKEEKNKKDKEIIKGKSALKPLIYKTF